MKFRYVFIITVAFANGLGFIQTHLDNLKEENRQPRIIEPIYETEYSPLVIYPNMDDNNYDSDYNLVIQSYETYPNINENDLDRLEEIYDYYDGDYFDEVWGDIE